MNIARHLTIMAKARPDAVAVKVPRGRVHDAAGEKIDYLTLTFSDLHAEVGAWEANLVKRGVREGDRVLVMVRQGLPLIAAVFALFRMGAVPVIIDPGMGMKSFLRCVAHSRPRVLLGIPVARFLSRVCRRAFRSVEIRVPASSSPLARMKARNPESKIQNNTEVSNNGLAAILFTSGSTGAPKGVCYKHEMFEAQVRSIRDTYEIEPGEGDLSMLPVFALFSPALGMTTIVPEIDPSRPATLDPSKIVRAIQQENVNNSFGSPTLWNKIADYCIANNITLPSMKRVLCAGAPVPAALWEKARKILPNGKLHSPYGATECLPVSNVNGDEMLQNKSACAGACVGRATPEIQIKIIAINDDPIAALADARELPPGEIGEIIVTGPAITREYDNLPAATAAAKIKSGDTIWHRMGDTGCLDADGRLWFCGRKAERVETAAGPLYTEPCEQVFRAHPQVVRCALVGLGARGSQIPAIVIQPASKHFDLAKLAAELRALALAQPHTAGIAHFFHHPKFPVDVRHNAKIHRLTLAAWAASGKAEELKS
ncbi:acyl-CoA synthetase (AMP-forming)/AMP-acid ligase II [Ereboglobus sp. PH5-10]|uniref:fatty acid CoA ligase family protein n=1 Tax=Ereboglobus sp. PH5-10 TaxID=2940629 RepID=UPI0024072DEF|nr:fatty acid CoA ligase family protein [Ereboglobus sp. PH5-10]MDF9826289.1 acyl-CoA synthetase (AMP-forming)/AMP-acid ligase II [Ereboglobus sp. PH5-10]